MRYPKAAVVALAGAMAIGGCGEAAGPAPGTGGTEPVAAGAPRSVPPPSPAESASASAPAEQAKDDKPKEKKSGADTAANQPKPGNPNGGASVPSDARAENTSRPDRVIGTGTPASCTSAAVVNAVRAGGVITFNCGPAPVTITMTATAKVRNAVSGGKVVLDGGGKVTLSGAGQRRILYQNTCDQAQGFTTSHCQDQDHPRLTVQNITFANGNSTGQRQEGGGGGAIFVRGGRVKVVNARFTGNRCDGTGPDLGGAALRALSQSQNRPVYVVNSTFTGGRCSNGGALSSIGVSWMVLNSTFTNNEAIGRGANPAKAGTPGGGSGGAIYTDGNEFTVTLNGTTMSDNVAREGGGAVFFVSNNRTGTMTIRNSRLTGNPSRGFETDGLPGIFFIGARNPSVSGSALRR